MPLGQLVYDEDYRDSLVVFADVLGMQREILSIDDDQSLNTVARVLQLLQELARFWSRMDGSMGELQATAVSDSLIISIPWDSKVGATALSLAMHYFQYDLLLRGGCLLRGYMAQGKLYHRDELVFGEGHIRAWRGERELKNGPPRIVIDPELVTYARERGTDKPPEGNVSTFEYLRQDACDGLWFIDYLKPVGVPGTNSPQELQTARREIREWITKQQDFYQTDHHVASKYHWLEQYEAVTRSEFESLLSERSRG